MNPTTSRKRKGVLCLLLVFLLLLSTVCVFGEEVTEAPEESAEETEIPTVLPGSGYWPEGIETGSQSAIVMETSTGTILYQKNIDEPHFPASITKIMTAIVALKHGNMNDTVTFSKEAVYNTEGSSIARDVGEEMTLEQCMYGMLLESANECAYAIAEHVGGTVEEFVDMMNEEAAALGCTNTHFSNPHGLPDETHYTSAHDMALISQEAWKNETFRIITGTRRYEIPPTNKHDEITYLQNHNEMLNSYKSTKYLYEYCVGGKTGYTEAAKSTLVTYAQKDGMTLVYVVMYADRPDHWTDSIGLFDYCFANFGLVSVADHETSYQSSASRGAMNTNGPFAELDQNASIVLPLTASFQDAESFVSMNPEPGDVVGTISYTYAGHPVGSVNVVATGVTAETYPFKTYLSEDATGDGTDGQKKLVTITPQKVLPVVILAAAIVVVILLLVRFSSRFHLLRQKFYRWKNSRSPYRRVRNTGFSKKRRNRRKRRKSSKI